jgi:murein DD-endopeptidase MepM/ murein hydrolase activator NlpD
VNVRCASHLYHNPFSGNFFLSYQALRNAAAAFATTQWVINLDADFIPTVETRAALRAAIQSHGYAADGRPLKRAFVVPPFAARQNITLPLNFSFISANLGDDASYTVNSFPEAREQPEQEKNATDERNYQCHANIDIQRWLTLSQQIASGANSVTAALYKVEQHLPRDAANSRKCF